MRQSILTVRNYKIADLAWQIVAFVAMCIAVFNDNLGPFGMYIMAAAQLISCIAWAIHSYSNPITLGRKILQKIFLPLSGFLIISRVCQPSIFFTFSYLVMLWAGPVLGLWYFLVTIKEIASYKQMAQKLSFR